MSGSASPERAAIGVSGCWSWPVERMTLDEVRRIASFQKMLDDTEEERAVVRKYGAA